ncbi:hypothetical protein ACH4Y0_03995 [Streptomyces sp. NPDC020707]|uniref:Type IV secretion system protein n=1 Tax=Streptomyces ortus TaxID=2867268 RepID=A0ABT3UZP8_9ACTN|nr:hypothetical protein [Streptomyces ortus]MCX4233229.1 hypothetical protein [Streptomyces ortus]
MFLADGDHGCGGGLDFFGMFDDPIGEMVSMVAKLVMRAAIGMFEAVGEINSYDEDSSNKVNTQTQWIVTYLAIGSILFAAIKMALDRKGDAGQTALKGVLRVTLVNTAASTVIITFATLMDRYSSHLFRDSLDELMSGIECMSDKVMPAMLMLVVGCLLILAGIIHALLMWIRLGVMVILMGTLPLAASASMTQWGGTWWQKHVGWLIAWLLYKPAVSLIFYSGAVMVNAQGVDQVNTQIAGMGVLLLSAIALPALMRVIVPATEALGGDSSGQATMGAASGIASGAKSIAGGAISRVGPGASGTQKPSGATGAGTGAAARPDSGGGSSSSGGGSPASGGRAAAAGGRTTPAAAVPVIGAAVLGAAAVAGKVAKGAVGVTRSGVEGANSNTSNDRNGH